MKKQKSTVIEIKLGVDPKIDLKIHTMLYLKFQHKFLDNQLLRLKTKINNLIFQNKMKDQNSVI